MTQRQRKTKAKRAGARRRKVNAAVVAWKKMNPGKKTPDMVRVKRLSGGGFSITPVKNVHLLHPHLLKGGFVR